MVGPKPFLDQNNHTDVQKYQMHGWLNSTVLFINLLSSFYVIFGTSFVIYNEKTQNWLFFMNECVIVVFIRKDG